MEVDIFSGLSGCEKASGTAVVIDVFRATTTLCCLLYSRPRNIYVGESHSAVAAGISGDVAYFSEIPSQHRTHDNSPLAALMQPLHDKNAILVSRNGTVALSAVRHCDHVFAAALINADALVKYLHLLSPPRISLIAIGHINNGEETIEDNICAEMLRARLLRKTYDDYPIRELLRRRIEQRRLDPESPQGRDVDLDIAISCGIGILDVVPKMQYLDTLIRVFDPRTIGGEVHSGIGE